jgi:hypothetical protein
MTGPSVKIVRPWPAEQPRPPIVHRAGCTCDAIPKPANTQRPPRTILPAA